MLSFSGIMFITIFNYCKIRFILIIVDIIIYYVTIENDIRPKIKTEQCACWEIIVVIIIGIVTMWLTFLPIDKANIPADN